MDIGCHLPTQGPLATREAVLAFCREAEARAIASLWVSDHVIFPRTASGQYQLAGYRRLGLTHVALDFRRDSLTEMLENLDVVAKEIRPAVDRS